MWSMFVDGMPFELDKEDQQLGGSETAGMLMAKNLAAMGHEVNLFGRSDREGIFSGVRYHNVARYPGWVTTVPHDVAIVQRIPQPYQLEMQSHVNMFWMHDLAMRRARDPMLSVFWNVNKVLVLSKFMRDQYKEVYGLPDDIFMTTTNGIDLCRIREIPEQKRDPMLLVYTARPERGLDILLEETFPRLLKADPEMKLVIAGYNNYVQELQQLYMKIQQLISKYGGRVRHVGALSKPDLYTLYKSAALYVYPSNFEEISCITAMECMACGLPMIGGTIGALPETLHKQAGKLIPWHEGKGARDGDYQENFAESCLYFIRNPLVWRAASEAGHRAAEKMDWSAVAEEWEAIVYQLLDEGGVQQEAA